MTSDTATDSPLEAAAGAAGSWAIEALGILANETRLSILLALWESWEPFAEDTAVPFSDLREQLGNPDSGQFNYHLGKLDGQFIRKTDDGYELRQVGRELIQTVIAGTGIEEQMLDETELERDSGELASPLGSWSSCPRCKAPTAVTYKDGWLSLHCTDCEGYWQMSDTQAGGELAGGRFAPAGLIDRTPEQALGAWMREAYHVFQSAKEGVCANCSGRMDPSLHVCEEHESDGLCENCGEGFALTVHFRCRVCKEGHRGPPVGFVRGHPAVIGFYYERGERLQYARDAVYLRAEDAEQELVSDDPPRVQVTYEYEGDRLEVLVDEEMNVLDVTEPD